MNPEHRTVEGIVINYDGEDVKAEDCFNICELNAINDALCTYGEQKRREGFNAGVEVADLKENGERRLL